MADNLSRLEMGKQEDQACIQEMIPDEQLMRIEASVPWYANYVNYLAYGVFPLTYLILKRRNSSMM